MEIAVEALQTFCEKKSTQKHLQSCNSSKNGIFFIYIFILFIFKACVSFMQKVKLIPHVIQHSKWSCIVASCGHIDYPDYSLKTTNYPTLKVFVIKQISVSSCSFLWHIKAVAVGLLLVCLKSVTGYWKCFVACGFEGVFVVDVPWVLQDYPIFCMQLERTGLGDLGGPFCPMNLSIHFSKYNPYTS